jgi:hypothetical protein
LHYSSKSARLSKKLIALNFDMIQYKGLLMDVANIKINEPDSKRKSRKITPVDFARAISSIIVFGIPLLAGTTAIIGYGIYRIFKKIK